MGAVLEFVFTVGFEILMEISDYLVLRRAQNPLMEENKLFHFTAILGSS